MRATVATFLLLLSEVAYAEVLPCRAEPATAYDTDPAAVRLAAQTGRAFFGAVLGVPVGLALAVIGIPIGAATSPLWVRGEHQFAEGAAWGACPGLLTFGVIADAGYYAFGSPAHGVWRVAERAEQTNDGALTEPLQNEATRRSSRRLRGDHSRHARTRGWQALSDLQRHQIRLMQAWIEIHCEELLADWNLAVNGEEPFTIAPLK